MQGRGVISGFGALLASAFLLAGPVSSSYAEPLAPGSGPFTQLAAGPTLSITDVEVVERNDDPVDAIFVVTLSEPSAQQVTVDWATGSEGTDFPDSSGQLTFAPGETSKQIVVGVWGDLLDEHDEEWSLGIFDPVGATIADAYATLRIIDNDPLPEIAVGDAEVLEGTLVPDGAVVLSFPVELSEPNGRLVALGYESTGGTAVQGSFGSGDYAFAGGTVVLGDGYDSAYINVTVWSDAIDESDETISLAFFNPVNAILVNASARGTILDDDGPPPPPPAPAAPKLSIADARVVEGSSTGPLETWSSAAFKVTLDRPAAGEVVVTYEARTRLGRTAATEQDFVKLTPPTTVTLPPGTTERTIYVKIVPDLIPEPDETFSVDWQVRSTGFIDVEGRLITGTIVDDDTPVRTPAPPPSPPELLLDTDQMPKRMRLGEVCSLGKRKRARPGAFEGSYEIGLGGRAKYDLSVEVPAPKGKPKRTLKFSLGSQTRAVDPFSVDMRMPISRERCARLLKAFARSGRATLVLKLGVKPRTTLAAADARTVRIALRR